MALEENGTGMIMPVQPMYGGGYGGYGGGGWPVPVPVYGGNYGGGAGNFFGGGDLGALLVIFLFGALFSGGGFGGFGMGGFGGMMGGANLMMWPWLMTNQTDNLVTGGFNNSAVQGQLSGIQSAVTSGFGDVQLSNAGLSRQICETGGNVTAAINGAASAAEIAAQGRHSALTQQLYNGEINSLNRSFAEQTANAQGFTAMQGQLAQCCCDNRLATVETQNIVQREAAQTRAEATAHTQAILDKLCQLELDGVKSQLDAERRANLDLQNRLNLAESRAQGIANTSRLLADNAAQTQTIENYVRPQINPAYVVPNPYAGSGYGWCGCCGNAA